MSNVDAADPFAWLNSAEARKIRRNMWRATFAAVEHARCPPDECTVACKLARSTSTLGRPEET